MAWIRSQDQKLLLNARLIEYSDKYDAHRLFADDALIGAFPTKESALKELDCIERKISSGTNGVYQVAKP